MNRIWILPVIFLLMNLQITSADFSIGDFQIDTTNDAPQFVAWFDSQILIDPFANVLFYLHIYDPDNSTTEISVELVYSNNSFATETNVTMTYTDTIAPNTYRYTYLFAGQDKGVYFQYFYTAFDGANNEKLPSQAGIYFDIQWDLIIVKNVIGAGRSVFETDGSIVPLLFLFGLIPMILLAKREYDDYTTKKRKTTRKLK